MQIFQYEEYYATHMSITFEIPMIIITNTKSLFLRRNRRIRKIKAGQGSSDDTQGNQQQQIQQQFDESFLQELSKTDLSQKISDFSANLSYQSSFHVIYNEQQQDEYNGQRRHSEDNVFFSKNNNEDLILQKKLNHLIIDLDSQIIQKKSRSENIETPLNSIQNQSKSNKQSSIFVEPIQDKVFKKNIQRKSHILSDYFGFVIDKPIRMSNLGFKYQSPIIQDSLKFTAMQIEQQKQQRADKRKKIRQKAQELLKRVRNEEELY